MVRGGVTRRANHDLMTSIFQRMSSAKDMRDFMSSYVSE